LLRVVLSVFDRLDSENKSPQIFAEKGLRAVLYERLAKQKPVPVFSKRHLGNKIDHQPIICGGHWHTRRNVVSLQEF
jgi:hypothetical protein